jgi:MtN3 and saliva related transmembrane protein
VAAKNVLAVVAATWGVGMAIAPLLQIRRILATRSSLGVSLAYLSVLTIGFALWLAYGISIRNPALVVSNVAALLVGAASLAVAYRFRPRPRLKDGDAG